MQLFLTVVPTVLLVVVGQIVTKWRVSELQNLAHIDASQAARLKLYLTDPFIITAYCLAVMSSISWMIVVERYDISLAYPIYIGLSLITIIAAGVFFFNEPLNAGKILALSLILTGVVLGAHYS